MSDLNAFIGTLNDYYVGQILLVIGLLLIWADYYFPIDGPCHFGYRAIELGVFLLLPFSILPSAAIALGVWILMELLHMIWLDDVLENEPDDQEETQENPSVGKAPA